MVRDVEMWYRDPIEVLREIMGNPTFKNNWAASSEMSFTDAGCTDRMIDESWDADWWNEIQVNHVYLTCIHPLTGQLDQV